MSGVGSTEPHKRAEAAASPPPERGYVEIVFETHQISTDNERGIATGWLHGELCEEGRRLAVEHGARRRGDDLTAIFTSDLRRAVETAQIAFSNSGVPIHEDAGCANATTEC